MARPGQAEREHVAGIVAGIRQQRHRVRQRAIDGLRHDERDIEQRRHREGGAECFGHVTVAARVTVVMRMTVLLRMTEVLRITVVVRVAVIVRVTMAVMIVR